MQLAALLLVTGAFLVLRPYLAKAVGVNPSNTIAGMSGSGTLYDPFQITTCQNLQDIDQQPSSHFILTGDIDCTDTINWGAGAGFYPLGRTTPFTGSLDGHGHTIDGLHINLTGTSGGNAPYVGLFSQASANAHFLNFSLTNATITGYSNSGLDAATGGIIGKLVDSSAPTISRVHFSGAISVPRCEDRQAIGGLVGSSPGTYSNHYHLQIEQSSSTGSINASRSGADCGEYNFQVGGLVGNSASTSITDSYSSMNITLNGEATATCTTTCRAIGGLIGFNTETTVISKAYASGALTVSGDSGSYLFFTAGGLVGKNDGNLSINKAYATTPLNVPSPCSPSTCDLGPGIVGGIVGQNNGAGIWSFNYFNTTEVGLGDGVPCSGGSYNTLACTYPYTGVGADDWKNSSTNPPFNLWDFTSTWQTTSVYPTLRSNSNPNPAAPTNLTATQASNSRTFLAWDASSEPSDQYSIFYRKTGATDWANPVNGLADNHQLIQGLDPESEYEFQVITTSYYGYASQPATVTTTTGAALVNTMQGSGTLIDPYQVTSCQDLQALETNLSAIYSLQNDIDCSSSSTWNGGMGFGPIAMYGQFTGTLDGHGHTIDGLYIDQSTGTGGDQPYVGLFARASDNARFLNFSLTNASITGNHNTAANGATGGIVGWLGGTNTPILSRVHFSGLVTAPNCADNQALGGLIGKTDINNTVHISNSSTTGTVGVSGTNCGQFAYSAGGFIGLKTTDTIITDSYSSMDVTLDGDYTQACTGYCVSVGGLVGLGFGGGTITNSYASGTLTVSGDNAAPFYYVVGGLYGRNYGPHTINNSFAATPFNVPPSCDANSCNIGAGHVGAIFAVNNNTIQGSNVLFDYTALGLGTAIPCIGNDELNSFCTGVNGDGSQNGYFKNNDSSVPLSAWNFSSTWQTTSGYPTLRSNSNPNPAAPVNLTAGPASNARIYLSWDASQDTGDTYAVYYKKTNDIGWLDAGSHTTSNRRLFSDLDTESEYEFRVITISSSGYTSQPATASAIPGTALTNTMQGSGTVFDPYQVSNCQDLQAIEVNKTSVFILNNDIDCSDTINWNGGNGFTPIGGINNDPFTGTLDGHGHSINGLYIDGTNNGSIYTGLFGYAHSDAHFLNFNITNATIIGQSSSGSSTGGVIGQFYYATGSISRVSFAGTISVPDCTDAHSIGGIAGDINGTTDLQFSHSSSTGDIMVSGSNCGGYDVKAGGLVGSMISTSIVDSYSSMNVTVDGEATADCGSFCRRLGGLVGRTDNSSISSSYASGMLTVSGDNGSHLEFSAGGLIGDIYSATTLTDNFAATPLNVPSPCDVDSCDNWPGYVGGVTGTKNVGASAWTNNFFDYTALGLGLGMPCVANEAQNTDCTGVNGDGSDSAYFKNNHANPPLDVWDFSSVWDTTSQYPILRANYTPSPAPTGLSIAIDSTTQVTASWNTIPWNTYIISYRRTGDTAWSYQTTESNNQTSISGLSPATQYDFRIAAIDADGYVSNPSSIVVATTATPGYSLISNCQQLQNMDNNLSQNYELSRDIDCSDTINWNGGTGFDPVGYFDFQSSPSLFMGVFAGNNYTISNLYSDQTTTGSATAGLFAGSGNAVIKDVRLLNPIIKANGIAASVVAYSTSSAITNVQVTNGIIDGYLMAGGGLVGAISSYGGISDSRQTYSNNKFTGSINSASDQTLLLGGLYGLIQQNIDIQNNYSNATITATGVIAAGGLAGGVDMLAPDQYVAITNSYAAGSIDTSISTNAAMIGSFIGEVGVNLTGQGENGPVSLVANNNFAATQLPISNEPTYYHGFIGIGGNSITNSISNYFDADLAGTSQCLNSYVGDDCQAVAGLPDYFKNNSTNPPLDQWDFTAIWKTTSEYPVFNASAVNTITTTTTQPPVTNGQTCFTTIFSTNVCPVIPGTTNTPESPQAAAPAVTSGSTGTTQKTASTPADEVGVLGAIKHFVRSLPTVVVVGFPYALFLLLGIAALVLLVELVRELRRLHLLQALIHKQQLLAEERDAFWHLAANYLRAPVTLIVGGAEALIDVKSTTVTQELSSIAASLQAKVAEIMKKIEDSTSLQAINHVQPRRVVQVARQAIFIIPVLIIAGLTLLGDYAATSYRGLNPGFVGYAMQLTGFILATVLFYWILSLLTQGKSKRKAAEATLERQTNELANARHELITDTANQLNPDLTKLESTFAQLPADQAALQPAQTLHEGSSRLREIVSSFAMLIRVQEGTGQVAAAPKAVDLTSLLAKTRAKLTPQITAKHVNISAPAVPLAVAAEADLANQVLESIIANAVDYSPTNGTVTVEARKLQDQIQVRISDQGQGIDKKQLDHLFQPFVRADGKSAMDMSHGGFGINLYLDKLIMEQLGGTITAESAPGKGTAFTLTWPA